MKSKDNKSLIPIALSERTVLARFVLWISGTAVGSISSRYARSVYNLKYKNIYNLYFIIIGMCEFPVYDIIVLRYNTV